MKSEELLSIGKRNNSKDYSWLGENKVLLAVGWLHLKLKVTEFISKLRLWLLWPFRQNDASAKKCRYASVKLVIFAPQTLQLIVVNVGGKHVPLKSQSCT